MPWDRKRLSGYVETMKLILGVTDKLDYPFDIFNACHYNNHTAFQVLCTY